jgi:hypothetical protein
MAAMKRAIHEVLGPRRARVAILGVVGSKRVQLRGMNAVGGSSKGRPFDSREQALAWLVG